MKDQFNKWYDELQEPWRMLLFMALLAPIELFQLGIGHGPIWATVACAFAVPIWFGFLLWLRG